MGTPAYTPYGPGNIPAPGSNRLITLATQNVAPPSALYVQPEDFLLVMVNSDFTWPSPDLLLNTRVLLPNGQISVSSAPLNGVIGYAGPTSFSLRLPEGWLLSANVDSILGDLDHGRVYASIRLCRGQPTAAIYGQMLAVGYISQSRGVSFPGAIGDAPGEGMGRVTVTIGTQPSAGADWSETVPNYARWRILGIVAYLTTSSAAANRQVQLVVYDISGSVIGYLSPWVVNQPASNDYAYVAGPGEPSWTPAVAGTYMLALPEGFILDSRQTIKSATANLQSGDQWSAPTFAVEQWMVEQH